jgi:hypothetical protein
MVETLIAASFVIFGVGAVLIGALKKDSYYHIVHENDMKRNQREHPADPRVARATFVIVGSILLVVGIYKLV